MNIIEIEDLSFSYKDKPIFEKLSVRIPNNSINFLIGTNGSGKTTFLKILFFNNKKYLKTDDFQFIWEFQNLYEELTVLQNFKIFFHLNKKKNLEFEKELGKILKYFNIKEYLNKEVKKLSYGYKQRVLIARSIMINPELLIIDEPFLGLDYSSYLSFLKIINDYNENTTFLISTQNPNTKTEFLNIFQRQEKNKINLNEQITLFTIL